MRGGGGSPLAVMPVTPVVKKLIILNISVWLILVMILQKVFLSRNYVFEYFGLVPASVITDFFIWQPLTYMFVHSSSFFHLLFNMLVLWMFGSELESRWGRRFFLSYYLVSGVGAAILYVVLTLIYSLISGHGAPLLTPVIGASGATFALILAYGLVFGERIVLFMFLFPMKAKYFALLLGIIELLTLLDSGYGSQVSNLCHLGGIVSGFLFLFFYSRRNQGGSSGNKKSSSSSNRSSTRRKLRLVVDNEPTDEKTGPRYWN